MELEIIEIERPTASVNCNADTMTCMEDNGDNEGLSRNANSMCDDDVQPHHMCNETKNCGGEEDLGLETNFIMQEEENEPVGAEGCNLLEL